MTPLPTTYPITDLCSVCRRTDGADELEVIGVPETNFDRCSEITPSETTRSTVRQRVRKTPRAKKVHLSHHFEEGVVIPGEWKREDVPLKDRWCTYCVECLEWSRIVGNGVRCLRFDLGDNELL